MTDPKLTPDSQRPIASRKSSRAADGSSHPADAPAAAAARPIRTSIARRSALELSLGLVGGVVIASVFGPRVISFWYEPPSQDAFSCASSVEQALTQFLKLQLGLALAGAIFLLLSCFFVRRFFRLRRERKAGLARIGAQE